jgi:hypothetical protein
MMWLFLPILSLFGLQYGTIKRRKKQKGEWVAKGSGYRPKEGGEKGCEQHAS